MTRPLLLLLLALTAAGCTVDVEVPRAALLACGAEVPCPDGWVCRPELGRCVPLAGLDTEPPRLASPPHVSPALGRAGTLFEVALSVSEPLARDPDVSVLGRPLTLLEHDGLAWRLGYVPVGDEPEGPAPVDVALVDSAGNAAEGLGGGTMVFDFTPPQVLPGSAEVTPGVARAGTVVAARFAPSEALGRAAAVLVGDQPATLAAAQPDDGSLLFEYRARGDEPAGPTELSVRLEDEAGNVLAGASLGWVELDFAPPKLDEALLPEGALRPGDVVTVVLTASEPLAGAPAVSLRRPDGARIDLERVALSPVSTSHYHVARAEDDGAWTLELEGWQDVAGNTAEPATLGPVTIDGRRPELVGAIELLDGGYVRAGAPVRLAFTASEPVRAPVVRLELEGAEGVPLEQEEATPAGEGTRFVFALVGSEGQPQGAGRVVVRLEDAVGNRGGPWTVGPVTLDFEAPTVPAGAARISPAGPVGLGQALTLEVSADEILGVCTAESAPAGLDLGEGALAGGSARWSRIVRAGDASGEFTLTVALRDLAGNEVRLPVPGRATVDAEPPGVLAEPDLGPSPAGEGATLRATFDTTEPLARAPRVWVGSLDLARSAVSTATHHVYAGRVAAAAVREGVGAVQATLEDAAGNTADVALGRIVFDFTPPRLLQASLLLEPPAGSARASVERVTNGTAMELVFTVSEALAVPPKVVATRAEHVLDLGEAGSDDGRLFRLRVEALDPPEATSAQGPWELRVLLRDLADNLGPSDPIELARPFEVDASPPAPPDAAGQRALLLRRAPWGSDESGGLPRTELLACPPPAGEAEWPDDACPEGAGAPFEPDTLVVVSRGLAGEDGVRCSDVEVARGTVDPVSGGLRLPIPGDWFALCVTASDLAGNGYPAGADEGRGVAVEQIEWTATMGGKVRGSRLENPHRYEAQPRFEPILLGRTEPESVEGGPLEAEDGRLLETIGGGGWYKLPNAGLFGETEYLFRPVVSDTARGRVDSISEYPLAWDGVLAQMPRQGDPEHDGAPAFGWGWAAAYDSRRGRTLLFGGAASVAGGLVFGDSLWAWHTTSWELLAPGAQDGGEAPPGRTNHALAYDSGRDRLVLLGGDLRDSGPALLADTWEWDADRWRRMEPEDPEGDGEPNRRWTHALVYDASRRRVVLVGGNMDVPGMPNTYMAARDLWEWDGVSWARRWHADEADGPRGRQSPAAAYDPLRERILLYGGTSGWGDVLNDLWEWDGATWTELHPAPASDGGRPMGLEDVLMAYHAPSGGLVVAGAGSADGAWLLAGDNWTRPPRHPDPLGWSLQDECSLAAGRPEDGVLLFGGSSTGEFADIRRDYARRVGGLRENIGGQPGLTPTGRVAGGMAYDDQRRVFVLFGGRCGEDWTRRDDALPCGDTWEYAGRQWSQRAPDDPEGDGDPSARSGHTLAWLAATGETMLFGGSTGGAPLGDTWAWNGASWRRAVAPGGQAPSDRTDHAVAVEASGSVLLYGGESDEDHQLGDTWRWDGVRWERVEPEDPEGDGGPGPRSGHALAEVKSRGRVLLAGGCRQELVHDALVLGCPRDLWEWDGGSWESVAVDGPVGGGDPLPRRGHAMVWDRDLEQVVLVGGQQPFSARTGMETWIWLSQERHGPGHRWTVEPPPGALLPYAAWDRLEVRFVAGGFGDAGGARTSGVRLLAWEEGLFHTRAEADGGLDAGGHPVVAPVSWTLEDGERMRRMLFSDQQVLGFALTTAAPAGEGSAALRVDYAEVRLRYRLKP